MTSLLEKLIAVIAPHQCILCSNYNNIICITCSYALTAQAPKQCFYCQRLNQDSRTCETCQNHTLLEYAWVAAVYEGVTAQAIKKLKFERARAAATSLAYMLYSVLPHLPDNICIVPIPTSSRRIRQRGYDQSLLIAKELAKLVDRPVLRLLRRNTQVRQVGSNRKTRQKQMQRAFSSRQNCKGMHVLLVDDVMTTGATLQAAAKVLRQANTERLWAGVVAFQAHKKL